MSSVRSFIEEYPSNRGVKRSRGDDNANDDNNQPPAVRPVNYFVRSEGPSESIFEGDRNKALEATNYSGNRTRSTGETVKAYMAAQAIAGLSTGIALPIFEPYEGIDMEEGDTLPRRYINNPNFNTYNDNAWDLTVPIIEGKPPQFNIQLAEAAQNDDANKPLVFLVTTKLPHAIIYILYEGKFYTVGYGFLRGDEFKNKIHDNLEPVNPNLAHAFEQLRGAIYTADGVAPNETHEAMMVWVGFLNTDMVNRMQAFLNTATAIIYNGTKNGTNYYVSNNAYVKVGKMYLEAAEFVPVKDAYYNCLMWAKNILNININCGLLGDPSKCKPITEDEFNTLRTNMNNAQLPQLIRQIQQRLERRWWGGRKTRKAKKGQKSKTRKAKKGKKAKTRKGKKSRRH